MSSPQHSQFSPHSAAETTAAAVMQDAEALPFGGTGAPAPAPTAGCSRDILSQQSCSVSRSP